MDDTRPKLRLRVVENETVSEPQSSIVTTEISSVWETGKEECRTPSPLINPLPPSPIKKSANRTIKPALTNFGFPTDIVNRAELIYQIMNVGTHRAKRLNRLYFVCVYNAYKELGIIFNPKDIASKLGMTDSEKRKAISTFSEIQTGYKPVQVQSTPLDLIPGFCTSLELADDLKDEIMSFGRKLIDNHPSLLEKYPQTVAAGIIKYYLNLVQVTTDNNRFASAVQMSAATVNSSCKMIMALDLKS